MSEPAVVTTETWYQNPDLTLAFVRETTVDDVIVERVEGGTIEDGATLLEDAEAIEAAEAAIEAARAADLADREADAARERTALIASIVASTGMTEEQVVAVYGL
jgi:hypothetical protein